MTAHLLRTTALCGILTAGAFASPAYAQSADEVAALRAQLAALSARLEALEGRQAQTEATANQAAATATEASTAVATVTETPPNFVIDDKGITEQVVIAGETPRSFKIPGTNTDFRITGFAKADFIYDFDQDVGDFFVPEFIETDPAETTSDGFSFHARQSRLSFQSRTPSSLGDIRTLVEGDFVGDFVFSETFSNSSQFRLRHAAVDIGPWKFGQFWSLFTPLEAYPSTLDFQGPAGIPFQRQVTARYTNQLTDSFTFAVAIENPETTGVQADGTGFTSSGGFAGGVEGLGFVAFDALPDFHLAGTYVNDLGTFKLAGVLRELSAVDTEDNVFGYGINASARMTPWEGGLVQLQGSFGEGIGRYIINGGGFGAFQVADGDDLESIEAYGISASVNQKFAENWDAQLVYGRYEVGDSDSLAFDGESLEAVQTVHATIRYRPLANVTTWLEFIYGEREDQDGGTADAFRIQSAVQVSF